MKLKLLSALLFLALMGCSPSDDSSNPDNPQDFAATFGASASRDFIGEIVDNDNNPIQNAEVKIGTTTTMTDQNGVFIINGASVHENFAYITAKKAGFIDGSRAMVPTTGTNNVKIMMIPSSAIATVHSGESSEVALTSGTKIAFDGAFQDESGNAYSGEVSVSAFHLMPSDAHIDHLMPGMLFAKGEDGEAKVLETFGMLHAELRGSGGQKLQIASGHTATMSMIIDPTQIATAPATIPLWHFDEANGYWKQEGSATKTGNKYIGKVSHFSWWNCDTFSAVVMLRVKIRNQAEQPLANVGVQLVVNQTGFTSAIQFTDNLGQVSGFVPKNQELTMKIFSSCDLLSTEQIGPFATATVLIRNVHPSGQTELTITGTLVDCQNNPVTDGYVRLNLVQFVVIPVTSGTFSYSVFSCNGSAEFGLSGYDSVNHQYLASHNYTTTGPVTALGTIQVCNFPSNSDEYISYKVDNNALYTFSQAPNSPFGFTAYANAGNFAVSYFSSPTNQFNLTTVTANGFVSPIQGPGDFTSLAARLDLRINGNYSVTNSYSANTITYHVTSIGAVGGYIDATFNGTFLAADNQSHTIEGTIHVTRDQ